MNPSGADHDEMGRKRIDSDADQLFTDVVAEGDERLGDLSRFVREVRDATVSTPSPHTEERHLRAIVEASLEVGRDAARVPAKTATRRLDMLRGSLIPKLAGGVLAAALVSSGLAYAGVEGAPNPVELVVNAATRGGDDVQTQDEDVPEVADANKAEAEANAEAAEAYANAVREWTSCVAAAAATHSETATSSDGFSPQSACGDHPAKRGLQPGQRHRDERQPETEGEGGPPENVPNGKPDGVPAGEPEETTTEQPDDTHDGPPADAPTGPGDTPAGDRP